MKEVVDGIDQNPNSSTRRRTPVAQPVQRERQTTLDTYFQVDSRNRKNQKRKEPSSRGRIKQSAATRTDKSFTEGSVCVSTQSRPKSDNTFERLRREIGQLKGEGKPRRNSKAIEVVHLKNRQGKRTRKFNCYSDRVLKFPGKLRQCLCKQDLDFDAESMSSQITDSINALQKELRKAITQLNDKEFTDSQ